MNPTSLKLPSFAQGYGMAKCGARKGRGGMEEYVIARLAERVVAIPLRSGRVACCFVFAGYSPRDRCNKISGIVTGLLRRSVTTSRNDKIAELLSKYQNNKISKLFIFPNWS